MELIDAEERAAVSARELIRAFERDWLFPEMRKAEDRANNHPDERVASNNHVRLQTLNDVWGGLWRYVNATEGSPASSED